MRTLAITQNATLDGAVEMLTDWFDPQGQGRGDRTDVAEANREQSERSDALLLGRRTFLDFRGYWPAQREHDTTGVSEELDRIQKYVVSSTLDDPGWQHSTVLTGDPVAEAQRLKEQPGRDIVCTGSITLSHALLAGGVVDEVRLWTHPAVQGRGRRLFPDGFERDRLELRECRAFRSGIVLTTYAVG